MDFRIWLEEQEIDRPYYRIINGMYGTSGKYEKNPISKLGPGTYWTPRWDAILMMLRTTLLNYGKMLIKDDDFWKTSIYQINNAIMDDPPKEHSWAHSFQVDAGEQVLVKALEEPKVLYKDILPGDTDFLDLVGELVYHKPPIDIKRVGEEVYLDGKKLYAVVDYDNYKIDLMEPTSNWESRVVHSIKSLDEFKKLKPRIKWDMTAEDDSISWFLMDMDKDAKEGIKRAEPWRWDEDI
jgi:hypothetical protein